jgi:hypothetical protein
LEAAAVIRTLLACASLLALGACASVPLASPQADQEGKHFDPPAQGAGVIYLYRTGWMASAKTVQAGVAGGYHVALALNTYFRVEGPPGPVEIDCKADNTAGQQININPGDIHFVEIGMHAGLLGPTCSVAEVSPAQGQAAIMKSKRVTQQ